MTALNLKENDDMKVPLQYTAFLKKTYFILIIGIQ